MAIAFARCEPICRRAGRNVVQRVAYIAREDLLDERTGQKIAHKRDGEPEHVGILLADGVPRQFQDIARLANGINSAERRKDAWTGDESVFPQDPRLTKEERIAQFEEFARKHWVSKGIPVIYALHYPHNYAANPQSRNFHIHAVTGTRALTADGFAPKKAPDVARKFLQSASRIFVSQAERWGKLWGEHQADWFKRHGKAITVDPLLPIHRKHLGPRRFQDPRSPVVREDARIQEVNHTIQARQQQQQQLRRNVSRETPKPTPSARYPRVERKPTVRPQPLTLEAIAREMSSDYAGLRDQARQQQALVYHTKGGRQKLADKIDEDTVRIKQRHQQLGQPRLLLHRIGRWAEQKKREVKRKHRGPLRLLATLQHPETKAAEDRRNARQWVHDQRWSIDLKWAIDLLKSLNRQADDLLDKLRPAAEAELQRRRQQIAEQRQQRIPEAVQQQIPRHRLKM